MIVKRLIGLVISLSLTGCAAYPRLMMAPAVPPVDASKQTELDLVLAEAVSLQTSYANGYARSARFADLSQLPLIGAAAAAA